MESSNPSLQLTREELIKGDRYGRYGRHEVDPKEGPITGYKKVDCLCRDSKLRLLNKLPPYISMFLSTPVSSKGIVELTTSGTIIRPRNFKWSTDENGRSVDVEYTTKYLRTDEVLVHNIEIKDTNYSQSDCRCYSWWDPTFEYPVGEVIKPDKLETNIYDSQSNGLHFFLTKEDAEDF